MKTLLLFLALATLALAQPTTTASVVEGKKVVFSYTLEKGTPPFTHQWFKDNQPIAGATDATFTIPRVAQADAGSYKVKVTNSAGFTFSDDGVITLVVAPEGAKLVQTVTDPDPT